jgi:hypothetical protein
MSNAPPFAVGAIKSLTVLLVVSISSQIALVLGAVPKITSTQLAPSRFWILAAPENVGVPAVDVADTLNAVKPEAVVVPLLDIVEGNSVMVAIGAPLHDVPVLK